MVEQTEEFYQFSTPSVPNFQIISYFNFLYLNFFWSDNMEGLLIHPQKNIVLLLSGLIW